MTAEQIVAEFEQHVNRLLARVEQPQPEAVGLDDLVGWVLPLVRSIGRMLVILLFERVQARQMRPFCPHCQAPLRRHGQRPRTLVCLLGEVRLMLPRWRCPACRHEVGQTLASEGVRRCCTRELWQLLVRLAVRLPYREVEQLAQQLDLPVSDDTVAALVSEVGGELSARSQDTAQAVAEGRLTQRAPRPPERLYLLVDGRMVRVEGQWRELKVGVIFETAVAEPDNQGRWPPAREVGSFACLGDADTFMRRFFAVAQARGVWDAQEVVLVADGAPWIWERLPQFVPVGVQCVEILDFYHAAGHVQAAVEAVRGPELGQFQARRLRELLAAGEFEEVVAQLRQLRDKAAGQARAEVQRVLGYLERHRHRMQYFRRHWEGYYIGSGRVESVCKQLGLRFKGCGMNWSEPGLEALLSIHNHLHTANPQPLPLAA